MKKNILPFVILCSILTACNKFLDRSPLDAVPIDKYLNAEGDLAAYSANLYGQLPSHSGYGLGTFALDNNSDNQAGSSPNPLFVIGQTRVPQSGGDWDFSQIRNVNYFINKVRPKLENGELIGSTANNEHYLGEMYFFRAFIYFGKLVSLGDFPILKNWITEDYDVVREASKRRPRNEVARFILQDLDSAYHYMKETPPASNRLKKAVAALMKSRVALFEGTWLKYHQGTARVPGGPGWPGNTAAYLANFSIDLDAEIRYFLTEAKEAAKIVADNFPLYGDYESMFNNENLSGVPEVLLWRQYDTELTPAVNHFVVGYIQRNGGGNSGYTRSMIESFLMENGLPIYAANSGYQGDENYEKVFHNRDGRLGYNVLKTGDLLTTNALLTEYMDENRNGYFYRPPITEADENRSVTGYSLKKGLLPDPAQGPTYPSSTASVVFRAAEAYLNYIEADYELNGSVDAHSDRYWKELRSRAGVETDYNITVAHTDMVRENDLATHSGGSLIDPILYNIRRERRVELAAEGFRYRDLKRWRSLDLMQDYVVEGFNLWDENYQLYANPENNLPIVALRESGASNPNVSSKSDSKYLLPYRVNSNNIAFGGYNWNPNKYLNPIAFDHFRLTTEQEGSTDYTTSSIYQNPGWKIETNSLPEGD